MERVFHLFSYPSCKMLLLMGSLDIWIYDKEYRIYIESIDVYDWSVDICSIYKWSMYNWEQLQCVIERVSCGEAEMILLSVLPVRVNYCNKQTAWQLGIFIFSSQQRATLSFRHECQTQKYLRNISGWPCLPTTVLIPHQNISNLFWQWISLIYLKHMLTPHEKIEKFDLRQYISLT